MFFECAMFFFRIHQESHGRAIGEVDGLVCYSAAAAGAVCRELCERCNNIINAMPTNLITSGLAVLWYV